MAISREELDEGESIKEEAWVTSRVSMQQSRTLRQLREEERMTQVCWREEEKNKKR